MRHLAVVLLAALVAVPATALERRNRSRRSTPVFELLYGGAPPSLWGAAHLSGGRGEAITTTRATVSTCQTSSSGGTSLAVNQPCVKPTGARASNTHSNTWHNSEDVLGAAWSEEQLGGVATPVETLDVTTGPFGNATADRVDFPATIAGKSSIRYNANALVIAGPGQSSAIWVRGVSGVSDTGTIDFCNHVAGAYTCQDCNFTSTAWTQCSRINFTATGAATLVGNATFYNGGTVRPAQSVYITAGQVQTSGGAVLHPYCPTAGATSTCNADSMTAPLTLPSTSSGWSYAATVTPIGVVGSGAWGGAGGVGVDVANRTQTYLQNNNAVACSHLSAGASITASSTGAAFAAGTPIRVACRYNAATKTLTAFYNGAAGAPVTNAAATNFTPTVYYVAGLTILSVHADGAAIHSTCYASNPDGCR